MQQLVGPQMDKIWGVLVHFWDLLAKLGAYVCVIKASSEYGMIQMFFKKSKCLIWVTTHKISSELPHDHVVILCLFLSLELRLLHG